MSSHSFPNLKILERIGSGSTAEVFAAERLNSGEKIALKVVSLNLATDQSARNRLRQEAITLQQLMHPGIVRIFNFHESEETLTLELEYVDGITLSQWLQKSDLTLAEPKIWILAMLAQALASAHTQGIVHRDVKPDNILISKNGEVKLTDFGFAKPIYLDSNNTHPGILIGSLAYMAPELLSDGKGSIASDIFSFGVIAVQLLSGQYPFPHTDIRSLLESLHKCESISLANIPALSANLEMILLQCLDVDPAKRPKSLWKVYGELMACLYESGIEEYCQGIVSNDGSLTPALEWKHSFLQNEITEGIKTKKDRKNLYRRMNEFSQLFPDAKETNNYLRLLHSSQSIKTKKIRYLSFLLFACILVVGVVAIIYQYKMYVSQANVNPNRSHIFSLSETKSTVPQLPTSKQIVNSENLGHTKALPERGFLQILAPSNVRIFIDGKRYGSSALRHLQLKVGSHQLLLEREGFDPIERSIYIKPGLITKINARSEESDE